MAQTHAHSGEVVSLTALVPTGARPATRALLKGQQLEVIHLGLPAGKTLPTHAAPGEITIQGLSGRIALTLGPRRAELAAGDWIHLKAGEPHAVQALDDASVLLTLSLTPAKELS